MRKVVIVLSVLIVGGLGAVAYSRSSKAADPGFKTVQVSRGEVVEKALAVGAIKPDQEISVKSKISGIVRKSYREVGDYVRAGEPLFEIQPDPTPLELTEARREVENATNAFDQAKRNAPCIVFVDEIDAVGRQRGAGLGGSHDEREQTLNQILVEMDGFDSATNVIVIAATNRPDVLDPALLRPGRFDRQVILDRPDIAGRLAVLEVHSRGKPFEDDIALEDLARQTPGFSGADLENLVNESAILAARRNKKTIGRSELAEAIDRVVAGPQRKSRVISEREKLMTAYHEAGHALVARMLPYADPVRKVSIVARGMMGGYTSVVPDEDRFFWTKRQFEDMLAYIMGGRVAEEIIFNEMSTGASNDIERATGLARKMVTEYGMSPTLGPLAFGKKEELVFLGREINEQRNYSDEVAFQIDQEIRQLINNAYAQAHQVLSDHRANLEAIAMLLMENETVDAEQLEALFDSPKPQPTLHGPSNLPAPVTGAEWTERREPDPAPRLRPQPASG